MKVDAVGLSAGVGGCDALVGVGLPPAQVAKVPEAPLEGAPKVTLTPGTGLPNWSTSRTSSCVAKAALVGALWLLPATMVMLSFVVLAVTVTELEPQLFEPFRAVTVQLPAASSP